mmetsp:Transcript_15262/g.45248  ORF Transcript_15262/g.45248 Transcript_15262/m.45248 type:complete len:365 (-) Transcript_15262:377-1471(-)
MTSREPPVAAQYVIKFHSASFAGCAVRSYMPCVAATSGTLSTTDDAKPSRMATRASEGTSALSCTAKAFKRPMRSRPPTAKSTPRKNRASGTSTRASAPFSEYRSSFGSWSSEVITPRRPRTSIMPDHAGHCVYAVNTGTVTMPVRPPQKTRAWPFGGGSFSSLAEAGRSKVASPSICTNSQPNVPIRQRTLGMTKLHSSGTVVTWPPMYSIVVVMSPIGVHAPPALEATTTMPPSRWRNAWSCTNFCSNEIMTITTVRLFSTEDRRNVRMPTTSRRSRFLVALIDFVMMSNPLCASMISTMVRAPSRKNTTSETSTSVLLMSVSNCTGVKSKPVPTKAQTITPRTRAVAALLISVCSSRTMTA